MRLIKFNSKGVLWLILFTMTLSQSYGKENQFPDCDPCKLEIALNSLSEHYAVLFSYKTSLVKNVEVSFEINEEEDFDAALNRLIVGLDLKYKPIDSKYYLLYAKGSENDKNVRRMERKIKSLRSLENETGIQLFRKNENNSLTLQNIYESAQTQQTGIELTGTVVNAENEPLIGVNVLVKGTDNGTATDFDGNFILKNVEEDAVLVFSYIGYVSQEIALADKTSLTIVLQEDSQTLDEIVVVGYGTMKKSDLSGAVGHIKGSDVSDRNFTQVSQALQGAAAGVMVSRTGGRADESANIRIRGITTIGDSNPLVIIDGVPGMGIDDINPNDIESMSVLKDAASAAIYGSRAAAGVILITTKRGKQDVSEFTYNFEYGAVAPTKLPEYTDAIRYMQMANELAWNDNGNNENEYPIFAQDLIQDYARLNKENPDLYPNTDWQNLIFAKSAPKQKHNFNFNVGRKGIYTTGSLNYEKVGLLYNYDDGQFERYTARINNDIEFSKILKANVNVFYTRKNNNDASFDPIAQARLMPSIYTAEYQDGRIAGGKASENPYGLMKYGGFDNGVNNILGAKASVDLKPFEGLTVTAVFSPILTNYSQKRFLPTVSAFAAEDPSRFDVFINGRTQTELYENRNEELRITKQLFANYVHSIDQKHNFNVMVGYEDYNSTTENLSASRTRFDLNTFSYLNLGDENYQFNGGTAFENAYISYFSRINYNYLYKYYVQANFRTDGSSRFHKNNRWSTFPSVSLAWVVSEESFLKSNSMISFLKLRGSWGLLGNERIGNYPYQSTISFGDAVMYSGGNATGVKTAAQVNYAIQDISWETTESWNLGVNLNLLNDKLQFVGDVFKKTTHDMLLALEIPDYMGYGNPQQNTGEMFAKGYELQLGWNDKVGDLTYSASVNFSDFKSIMGDLGGTEFIGDKIRIEGSEFDEWYGYLSDGIFLSQSELDNYPTINSSVQVGDMKFLDVSGPEGVPDGVISPDYDRVFLGGSLPRFLFGGTLKLNYKNFDMSTYFQGVGKQNVINNTMSIPLRGGWQNIPEFVDGDYYSSYNTDAENAMVKYPRLSSRTTTSNYTTTNHFMINGGYFRLQNVTLGYSLPKNILNKISAQGCRFYISASDLVSFDNYPRGWDPESAGYNYFPIASSFVAGVSLTY